MELFLITIAWLFGILSGLYFKISIVLFIFIIIIFGLLKNKNKYLKFILKKRYIIIFTICYLISYFQITCIEKNFDEKYKNIQGEIQVIGTIISNPSNKEYKTTYTIQVHSINNDESYKNTNLLLNVKKDKNEILYSYGNKISFISEFEEPTSQRNEGGFDYKQYLKTKNIYGIVETRTNKIKIEKENNANIILKLANTISNSIEKQSNKLLNKNEASLLTGILIGNKQNLDEDITQAFRSSNLSHMLAVSGAHVSYVIIGITFAISISKIGKRKSKIITIIFLLFFILITGKTPSVTRACIMAIYILLGNLCHKKITTISSINISLLLLMVNNPYCILDIGFQLSYGGTIGIITFYKPLKRLLIKNNKKTQITNLKEKIQEMLLLTISANIIIFPIIMFHFNNISLSFLISNLLASPIMGVLILLGFITIIFSYIFYPISKLLAVPLNFLLKLFMQIAIFSSNLPFSKILVPTPRLISIILYYIFIFFLLFYKNIKEKKKKRIIEKKILSKIKTNKKKAIAIILILITISLLYKQIPQNLKIYFVDVGQGDSTLIVTPNKKTILIDGGGSKDGFDVGEKVLLPYLLDRRIRKINYAIITHFDADHVNRGSYHITEYKSRENNYK